MKPIYLDNNATSHMDPVVAERMHELNLLGVSNPASQHRQGRQALHLLEAAKSELLDLIGAPNRGIAAARIVFTSGGTEANNLAVFGLLAKRPGIAIVGATDHPSVLEAARIASGGTPDKFRVMPVDRRGLCNPDLLLSWLSEIYRANPPDHRVSFVSVMLGNNETGVIQNLKAICDICARFEVPVHSDIVQAVGKMPFHMADIGLSAITLTAHKIHGPVGIGALVLNHDIALDPMIVGGGQQLGLRAGTEPVIPAVALSLALAQICSAREAGHFDSVRDFRDRFEHAICQIFEATVIAAESPRLPHTSNIAFPGLDRQALHMSLDLQGLACSTGSACASGSSRPSSVLTAMGLPLDHVLSSLRFSFSRFSTQDEVDLAIKIVSKAVDKCRIAT